MPGLLSAITFLPLFGALYIMFVEKEENREQVRWTALGVSLATLIISLPVFFMFDGATADFQFQEIIPWIPQFGITYHLGVDGISVLILFLIVLLTPMGILCSWKPVQSRVKEFHIYLLLLEVGMSGTILSLDFFMFYIFWEFMLIPMFLLILLYGSDDRLYAGVKFFLYTLSGSVLMLLGVIALYLAHGQVSPTHEYTFSMLKIMEQAAHYPFDLQIWVFLVFFLGFAIKVPMFPFHTWLPDAHVQAPTAGSVILAGVLLKMGAYGFLRFSLPMLPDASMFFAPYMGGLGTIAAIWCALVAMGQKDMKKLVAYSSVSHMGYIILGTFAFSQAGIEGALLQMFNHGVVSAALFLMVGVLYERRHTKLISEYGGLFKILPVFTTLSVIFVLASIGIPFLNGFIAEYMIFVGGIGHNVANFDVGYKVLTIFTVIGVIFGASYMLWCLQRVFLGHPLNPLNKNLPDLDKRELWCLVPLAVLTFWVGIYPVPWLSFFEGTVSKIVLQYSQHLAGM